MSLMLILNIVLAAGVIVAVVGPLVWSIRTSRPATEFSPARTRPARERAHRARAAHAARARTARTYATESA